MSTITLLGIGGYPGAGKDTIADFLVSTFGWAKVNMSTPVREHLCTLDPIVDSRRKHWYSLTTIPVRFSELTAKVGYVKAKENSEYRRLLKVYGTNVGRKIDEDIWVNIARDRIEEFRSGGKKVVITGMRFPNELQMIRNLGGTLLWVDRPQLDVTQHQHSSDTSVHPTDFDGVITNDSPLTRLYIRSVEFLEKVSSLPATH